MTNQPEYETADVLFPAWQRACLSILIASYLLIVILGPLSNPIASENLTRPLANVVRPVHESMFLGHGYRFFGPDPGPSHIVEYAIVHADGQSTQGTFPDRDQHWPRLLYHRWFMLSETIFSEGAALLDDEELERITKEMEVEIEARRSRNETAYMHELVEERDNFLSDQTFRKARTQSLLQHVANHLLETHDGKSVEIALRERLIPSPAQIASRIQFSDDRLFSQPRSFGTFQKEETAELEAIQ